VKNKGAGMDREELRGPDGEWLRQAVVAGTVASLLSTAMLAFRGRRDVGAIAAPLNAPGHWLFGSESLRSNRPSWRHTLSGFLIHHGSSLFWSLLYSRVLHWQCRQHDEGGSAQAGMAGPAWSALGVTLLAAWVDFRVVPERLTPGFEHRLSRKSLVLVYGAFALGLALGGGMRSTSRAKR
jgi:hypothetical protein